MTSRGPTMEDTRDGSAGDVDYRKIGMTYSSYRQPDPRIAALVDRLLEDAVTVLNVGAGAGSYEPPGRLVTALEPSASMRAQRPAGLATAIDGVAEALPFDDGRFDASMSTFSVHQWSDVVRGLQEMRRVTRGPVLVMTCDPRDVQRFWLNDYVPEVLATEARRYPAIDRIAAVLGGTVAITPVPIPLDCTDGFNEAYYGRPEMFLDPAARLACSAWSFVPVEDVARGVSRLRDDLASGAWDARHGHLRSQPTFDGSLRMIVARAPIAASTPSVPFDGRDDALDARMDSDRRR